MPPDSKPSFAIVPASSPGATILIAGLDRDLSIRYPGEPINGINAADFEARAGIFALCTIDSEPAACGAFRPFEGAAEIKRMYVAPDFRRRGLGRQILRFLIQEAGRRGHTRAILETGDMQTEAIALYTAEGWTPIPAFGPYTGDPRSRCFEKRLVPR